MKLPRNFGGQGYGGMLKNVQQAMARAQTLEQELALEQIVIDKGPVKVVYSGTGEIQKLTIDKRVVDPEEVEALEDLILIAVREGFAKATELRNSKVQEITQSMPNIPGL